MCAINEQALRVIEKTLRVACIVATADAATLNGASLAALVRRRAD
jgi:hypothetical protein